MTRRQIQRIAMLLCLCIMSLQTFAQNRVISIKTVNEPIVEVMKKIEKTSGFTFFYNDSTIDKTRKVSVDAKNEDIEKVLQKIFASSGTQFSIMDRNIVLSKANGKGAGITPPTRIPDIRL